MAKPNRGEKPEPEEREDAPGQRIEALESEVQRLTQLTKKLLEERGGKQEEKPSKPDPDQTLKDIHQAVILGKRLPDRLMNWEGTVIINKTVVITVTNLRNKSYEFKIEKETKTTIGLQQLQQLVLLAVQEGPEEKRKDWNAKGDPRSMEPLKINIVEERVTANSPLFYEKQKGEKLVKSGGVPALG